MTGANRKFPASVMLFLLVACYLLVPFKQLFAQTRPDALQAFREGNYERSVQICRAEIAENPNNLESHVVISWALIRLGRFNEAMNYALAGRRISRYDLRIINSLGEISFFMGRNNEALQFFQEFLTLAHEGTRVNTVYYYIGEIFIRQGRFRHADVALSTAVHWSPGNALWWTRLGFARENAGDLREAVVAYERALSLNPQLVDAQRGLERVRQALARF